MEFIPCLRREIKRVLKWVMFSILGIFIVFMIIFMVFSFTNQNKLAENSKTLKQTLDLFFAMDRRLACLLVYAKIWRDEDLSNDQANEACSKIEALNYTFEVKTSWLEPEILKIPSQQMAEYLKDPVLKEYHFYLENRLRWKDHTLPLSEEELLAKAQKPLDTPKKTFSALNGLDVTFQPIKNSAGQTLPLTHGSYYVYIKSPDRTLRENAFNSLSSGYEKMENTLTHLLSGHVQKHIFNAKATHFKSSLANKPLRIETSSCTKFGNSSVNVSFKAFITVG